MYRCRCSVSEFTELHFTNINSMTFKRIVCQCHYRPLGAQSFLICAFCFPTQTSVWFFELALSNESNYQSERWFLLYTPQIAFHWFAFFCDWKSCQKSRITLGSVKQSAGFFQARAAVEFFLTDLVIYSHCDFIIMFCNGEIRMKIAFLEVTHFYIYSQCFW